LRSTRLRLLIICLGLFGTIVPPAAAIKAPGERFFPQAGNPGYRAFHYGVELRYHRDRHIDATVSIDVRASEPLHSVSFDFFGPRVGQVMIDGRPVGFRRSRGKLIVTPRRRIAKGDHFLVTVRYSGVPPAITDPDGSREGWFPTDDGVVAVGEPQGTAAWIPCDNTPADKASFTFGITVPKGLKAVANGRMGRVLRRGGLVQYSWREGKPMSPYLAVLNIGRGRIAESKAQGLPYRTLVDPRLEQGSLPVLSALPGIIRFESGLFGEYPFEAAGSLVDYAPGLGYALETQSRPIYAYVPDLTTVVHETAHQWFGDSVGIERWPEIWLNEGFATWTEWYYAERHGGQSAQAIFRRLYRVPASNEKFWDPPSAHPGSPEHLFGPSVYVRGAMALQALRVEIGTGPMLRLLRTWTVGHRYGSGTIREFVTLAEEVSGKELGPFFQRWLYRRGKP
jgi:aminopeptidase N